MVLGVVTDEKNNKFENIYSDQEHSETSKNAAAGGGKKSTFFKNAPLVIPGSGTRGGILNFNTPDGDPKKLRSCIGLLFPKKAGTKALFPKHFGGPPTPGGGGYGLVPYQEDTALPDLESGDPLFAAFSS